MLAAKFEQVDDKTQPAHDTEISHLHTDVLSVLPETGQTKNTLQTK